MPPMKTAFREITMNLSEKNEEIVRAGYAAFNTADMAALTRIFAETSSWTTPGHTSIAGQANGRAAVFARFGRYGGETAGTFKASLKQVFTTADGKVIGLHRNTGTRNGKQLDTDCCIVFEVENGQITSGTEFFFDLHGWDQFWA